MPIFEFLEKNAREFPDDIALVEINPLLREQAHSSWKDFDLIEPVPAHSYRKEISWRPLTSKPTGWPVCCAHEGFKRGTRWPFC